MFFYVNLMSAEKINLKKCNLPTQALNPNFYNRINIYI